MPFLRYLWFSNLVRIEIKIKQVKQIFWKRFFKTVGSFKKLYFSNWWSDDPQNVQITILILFVKRHKKLIFANTISSELSIFTFSKLFLEVYYSSFHKLLEKLLHLNTALKKYFWEYFSSFTFSIYYFVTYL